MRNGYSKLSEAEWLKAKTALGRIRIHALWMMGLKLTGTTDVNFQSLGNQDRLGN
jgi:hypothetical protein